MNLIMKQKSVKFNFIMNAVLTASTFIFPLITYPYVSRILGPDGIGKVSFATSVIYYFSMFAQLGIPTYGISACARVRDDKVKLTRTAHEIMSINLVMTIFVYIAYAIMLFAVPKVSGEKPLFIVMGLTIIFNTIGVEWLYKALEQYSYITTVSIIFKFISVVAMFAFVNSPDDYVIYGGISIIAGTGSNLMNFLRLRKFVSVRPVGRYNFKKHIKAIVVFFAMSVAVTIYTNLDTVMLGFMKTDADVGYYNTAVKVKNILCSVVTSLGTVLLPRMSHLAEDKKWDDFYLLVKKAINFVLLISLPLMVFFMIFAKDSVLLLSGEDFLPAVVPMQITMPTIVFIGLTNVLGIQVLVPLGKEKQVLYSELAAAILKLLLNIFVISRFASSGAAAGTVLAELTVLVVQAYALRDKIGSMFKGIAYNKIVIALGAASVVGIICNMFITISPFLNLAISSILFFAVYGVLLLVMKENLVNELFNQIMGKFLKLKKKN